MLKDVLNTLIDNPYDVIMKKPNFIYHKDDDSYITVQFHVTYSLKDEIIKEKYPISWDEVDERREKAKKKTLDEKVKELESEGLVEDITDSKQAIMNNIKEFAMEITNQDLDKARAFTAQALGVLNMSKNDVSFGNMQSVKNKIQDIATEARTHVDKGE